MIPSSQLILNPNGSLYHINLLPEQLAHDIITVGDPDRVSKITERFDEVEFTVSKREFRTQTGTYKGKRLTVISTGIGPDNIDIVLNELDALVNIDLKTREIKAEKTRLNLIRLGTSGAIQPDIPIGSFVLSERALGTDTMLRAYDCTSITDPDFESAFVNHTGWAQEKGRPYAVKASDDLIARMSSDRTVAGITATAGGFYGPQGRVLRLNIQDPGLNDKMLAFDHQGLRITNLEMETAAIYGLSALLGHNALSMSAIIANRANETFSEDPEGITEALIDYALEKIVSSQ